MLGNSAEAEKRCTQEEKGTGNMAHAHKQQRFSQCFSMSVFQHVSEHG